MKTIEVGNSTVQVYKEGYIETVTTVGEHKITDEFYPFVGNTTETVVDEEVGILPNSFKKRVIPL
jgi:hypothetical protein